MDCAGTSFLLFPGLEVGEGPRWASQQGANTSHLLGTHILLGDRNEAEMKEKHRNTTQLLQLNNREQK